MEKKKRTGEEMKNRYPNEWLRVINYEVDRSGHLKTGVVLYHSTSKHETYSQPLSGKSEAFWYTGESTFSGFRSHAENNAF